MNATDEKLYKTLHDKELTRYEVLDLTFGMKELAARDGIISFMISMVMSPPILVPMARKVPHGKKWTVN